ncbi:triose-phosphate isomerase [Micromonospora sp. M12]
MAKRFDQETADQVRVLYGGSVKASNVASIMAQPDVDGAWWGRQPGR